MSLPSLVDHAPAMLQGCVSQLPQANTDITCSAITASCDTSPTRRLEGDVSYAAKYRYTAQGSSDPRTPYYSEHIKTSSSTAVTATWLTSAATRDLPRTEATVDTFATNALHNRQYISAAISTPGTGHRQQGRLYIRGLLPQSGSERWTGTSKVGCIVPHATRFPHILPGNQHDPSVWHRHTCTPKKPSDRDKPLPSTY